MLNSVNRQKHAKLISFAKTPNDATRSNFTDFHHICASAETAPGHNLCRCCFALLIVRFFFDAADAAAVIFVA